MKKKSLEFTSTAIAYVQSPFKDKFGIPRQPGLASQARGVIKFNSDPDLKTALNCIEQFSHLWIIFVFHEHGGRNWKPSIRPPRLGGNQKVGVLASRSPHRPNPIGLSAVTLEKVDLEAAGGPELHVAGLDLLDGTPVLDVKPYIPYADSIPDANPGWASGQIIRVAVTFSEKAESEINIRDRDGSLSLRALAVEVLELDPRPAYMKRQMAIDSEKAQGTRYGIEILGFDFKYQIQNSQIHVYDVLDMKK